MTNQNPEDSLRVALAYLRYESETRFLLMEAGKRRVHGELDANRREGVDLISEVAHQAGGDPLGIVRLSTCEACVQVFQEKKRKVETFEEFFLRRDGSDWEILNGSE